MLYLLCLRMTQVDKSRQSDELVFTQVDQLLLSERQDIAFPVEHEWLWIEVFEVSRPINEAFQRGSSALCYLLDGFHFGRWLQVSVKVVAIVGMGLSLLSMLRVLSVGVIEKVAGLSERLNNLHPIFQERVIKLLLVSCTLWTFAEIALYWLHFAA